MSKSKPRWKDLPFYERFVKQLKQHGVSEEMCEHIRERGREIEKGMKLLLSKYVSKNERKIIDDVFMTLTGWSLKSLLKILRGTYDTEV